MINNTSHSLWDRLQHKTLNQQFTNRLIEGLNCSPFEAKAILDTVYEIFAAHMDSSTQQGLGDIHILCTGIENSSGKPLKQASMVRVRLTLDGGDEDRVIRRAGGPVALRRHRMERITHQAYQKGGLLSMRDLSLLCWHPRSVPSKWRAYYEQLNQCELPHPGNLQDMGSCITHKEQIVYKAIVEKKDPVQVANESKHTQQAVDRYLKDFHRVQTVYHHNSDPDYISLVTNISKSVVNQYINLIEKYDISDK